jgi:hypothetical protein
MTDSIDDPGSAAQPAMEDAKPAASGLRAFLRHPLATPARRAVLGLAGAGVVAVVTLAACGSGSSSGGTSASTSAAAYGGGAGGGGNSIIAQINGLDATTLASVQACLSAAGITLPTAAAGGEGGFGGEGGEGRPTGESGEGFPGGEGFTGGGEGGERPTGGEGGEGFPGGEGGFGGGEGGQRGGGTSALTTQITAALTACGITLPSTSSTSAVPAA